MFRQIYIFALFATCVGYCWADEMPAQGQHVPIWPAPGSDADVPIGTNAAGAHRMWHAEDDFDNIRIVSNIGDGMVVQNNISIQPRGGRDVGFSGGANLTHGYQAPAGFNIHEHQAEMPLMHQAMMEDDGGQVLAMSRSGRRRPDNRPQMQQRIPHFDDCQEECPDIEVWDMEEGIPGMGSQNQVQSWVVTSGSTLREILQEWSNREGWDLVWSTAREYPIQASAVFKGRYMDVSSALVRNFSRANPVPYAKFYKGNRVLVISTAGGE